MIGPSAFALLVASVATFLVFVPLTALALNGGVALDDDQPLPSLTPRIYALLFVLWTASAWLGAALTSLRALPA